MRSVSLGIGVMIRVSLRAPLRIPDLTDLIIREILQRLAAFSWKRIYGNYI